MKQRLWMAGLVVMISLGLCAFSGCKKADEAGTGTEASVPGGAAPAASQASDWPADVPTFEGGQLAKLNKDASGQFQGAVFTGIKDPESTFQQYKAALEAKGWVLGEDLSTPVAYVGAFDQGERGVHVSVSKDGLMANVMYLPD